MADLNLDLIIPPPPPPPPGGGNYGWRPPMRDRPRFDAERANAMPIVIAVVLSLVLLILFLWFFLSPRLFSRRHRPPHTPLDMEDAYFVDENVRTRPPHINGAVDDDSSTTTEFKDTKNTQTPSTVASPPPAYSACPNSPHGMDNALPFFTRLTRGSGGSRRGYPYPYARPQRSFRHLLGGVQHMLTRSVSAPLPISKPIPHPESPLPGHDILATSNSTSNANIPTQQEHEETTALRPGVAPLSVSANTLHPPSIYLPSPSQAVVYNANPNINSRDSLSRSSSDSRFLSTQRFSANFGFGWAAHSSTGAGTAERDVSVTSSNIGIAF
ncbi:hypothetical protein BDN70DRAFT_993547 [Pholiota conissans]|uniref:Uncharacterized protein n=1 Tax=Pholiota conissans TaxID=109636 RepID=A0A9P5Z0U0_9AGAR|nr:hypothetical protein BDN70DRAFT_993547 [Pholiota conissans]